MNLTNPICWSLGLILALSGAHNIDTIQRAVWRAQARVVFESRTSTWGSPSFLGPQGDR